MGGFKYNTAGFMKHEAVLEAEAANLGIFVVLPLFNPPNRGNYVAQAFQIHFRESN
jgi:hypothetical protein